MQGLLWHCAVMVLAAVCTPALALAQAAAAAWGPASLLLVVPALWLGMGCALCAACVLSARLLLPPLSPHRPLPLFGAAFARWWLVRCTYFTRSFTSLTAYVLSRPCRS